MTHVETEKTIYLLTIRGTLAPSTLEGARTIHNETAGADDNVAAARALGDLSHLVYINAGDEAAGELLIMDLWNSAQGLGSFFQNPQVQEQGGRIFKTRDPVVWAPASEFFGFHILPPSGRNERFVGLIRGTVRSREAAREALDSAQLKGINRARRLGQIAHESYFRAARPGEPDTLEFLGVDIWSDGAGMKEFYSSMDHAGPVMQLFTAPPDASIWKQPAGRWVEW